MSKKVFVFGISVFLSLFLFSCKKDYKKMFEKINQKEMRTHKNGNDILNYIKDVENQRKQCVFDFVSSLDLEEKVAQLFIVNLAGNKEFVPVEKNIAGGFLFFSYNLAETSQEIISFTQSIEDYCYENNKIPPFLAADQEGGFVNRLKNIAGPLPSNERVAKVLSTDNAAELYELQALQMNALGFNINLAPVVEVCTEKNKTFLNQRSFGSLDKVLNYGKECINSYEKNNIGTVIKHFPGNTNTDPHTGLPEIDWTNEEFNEQMEPFKQFVKLNPSGVLMSHARVKGFDENTPACLSKLWVTEKLRNEMGYEGIIFSDDIFMGALADNGFPPEKAAIMAIEAGIDCIMISEKRINRPVEVICNKAAEDSIFMDKIDTACKRIIDYKLKNGILKIQLNESGKYQVMTNYTPANSDQLQIFNDAKKKNTDLYLNNF